MDRAGDLDLSLLLNSISRSLKLDRTGAATGDLDRSLWNKLDRFGDLDRSLDCPNKPEDDPVLGDLDRSL